MRLSSKTAQQRGSQHYKPGWQKQGRLRWHDDLDAGWHHYETNLSEEPTTFTNRCDIAHLNLGEKYSELPFTWVQPFFGILIHCIWPHFQYQSSTKLPLTPNFRHAGWCPDCCCRCSNPSAAHGMHVFVAPVHRSDTGDRALQRFRMGRHTALSSLQGPWVTCTRVATTLVSRLWTNFHCRVWPIP